MDSFSLQDLPGKEHEFYRISKLVNLFALSYTMGKVILFNVNVINTANGTNGNSVNA